MYLDAKQFVRALTASAVVALVAVPQSSFAQATEHIVSPADLQKATVDASQVRQKNLDTLNKLLSSAEAQKALESAHMNPAQVKTAIGGLNDQELAQLSTRANKAQADFAAGYIGERDLLLILVAIAVIILIIVAVR